MSSEKQVVEQPTVASTDPVSPLPTSETIDVSKAPVSPLVIPQETLPEVRHEPLPEVQRQPVEPLPPSYQAPAQFDYPKEQPMSRASPPVTPLQALGDVPSWVDCPYCHRRTMTRVEQSDSSMTMLLGVLLCLICICAACIPCIAHWCADVDHYCSSCSRRLTHRPYNGVVQVLNAHGPEAVPSRYAAGSDLENGGVRPPAAAAAR